MKKYLSILALAFVAMTTTLSLTSCGDDDDDDDPVVEKNTTATFTLKPNTNATFNSLANEIINYFVVDANGDTVKYVHGFPTTTEKTISDVKCPCKITYSTNYELKPDAVIVPDSIYYLEYGVGITIKYNGSSYASTSDDDTQMSNVKGKNLEEFMQELDALNDTTVWTVDANGKIK